MINFHREIVLKFQCCKLLATNIADKSRFLSFCLSCRKHATCSCVLLINVFVDVYYKQKV